MVGVALRRASCLVLQRALREKRLDAIGDLDRRLVFPSAHNDPPKGMELLVGVAIPCDVAIQLGSPVRRVGARIGSVLRAPVPEAPVDEDGELMSSEHDVRLSPPTARQPDREPRTEASSTPVKDRTHGYLGRGVAPCVGAHGRTRRRRGGNGPLGVAWTHKFGVAHEHSRPESLRLEPATARR